MKHLLLLHGAAGAKDQFEPIIPSLSGVYQVHAINFSGHGGENSRASTFSIALFAQDVLHYMAVKQLETVDIFGYSMGGYVALYIARYYPEKIGKIITLASKLHWDEAIAAKEIKLLNAATIQQKVPAFAQQLAARHGSQHWETVLEKVSNMLLELGNANTLQLHDYNHITHPVLLLLGDRDKMVSMDETVAVFKQFPYAQMAVLPGTPHPIEQVNVPVLVFFIQWFLK